MSKQSNRELYAAAKQGALFECSDRLHWGYFIKPKQVSQYNLHDTLINVFTGNVIPLAEFETIKPIDWFEVQY